MDTLLAAGKNNDIPDKKDALLNEEMLRIFCTFTCEEREKIIKILHIWKNDFQNNS